MMAGELLTKFADIWLKHHCFFLENQCIQHSLLLMEMLFQCILLSTTGF